MARSIWKGPFVDGYLLKKAETSRASGRHEMIKIWSRRSTILPQFVGLTFGVYNGMKHIDIMKMFNDDPQTEAVIMVGEIGGADEEECARWIKTNMSKPVVGFIAGVTAPPGKRMGHAGAIISGGKGTAAEKIAVMEACGIKVTRNPAEMGKLLKSVLK